MQNRQFYIEVRVNDLLVVGCGSTMSRSGLLSSVKYLKARFI